MAWVDEHLLQIRTLITEDWKLEDNERMQQVCLLYVQARLDHARDTFEADYSKELKTSFSREFNQMLCEARAFESADLLRDRITSALFTLPPTANATASPQPAIPASPAAIADLRRGTQ